MNINEIELRHLRCFVTLAEELNFGRAAERLHMSQPPLTRLVADVEEAVGAKLFERTTRRVALTAIGGIFIAEANAVLARSDEALRNVIAARDKQAGLLRLAYTPFALQAVLPHLLSLFRERDHDTRIDLVELTGPAQLEALKSGRVDLAFSEEPLKEEGYANLLLYQAPLSLVVPGSHPLAARKSIAFKSLNRETLILHPRQEYPDYYGRIASACAALEERPRIQEREAGQNCMALVVSEAGLLLTAAGCRNFQSPGLRCLEIEPNPLLRAEVWAAWVKKSEAGRVQALIEIAQTSRPDMAASSPGGGTPPPATPSTR